MKAVTKAIMAFVTLSTITSAAFAQEKVQGDFKTIAMMQTIIEKCPEQFSKALGNGRILTLESATEKNSQNKSITTTKLSMGVAGNAMFQVPARVLATLEVVEMPYDVQPADGYLTQAECKLELK